MSKKYTKKLGLRTETLRQLDPADLGMVAGGKGKDGGGAGARRTARCNSVIEVA